MGEIAEESVAKWIVAGSLNGRAPIGVTMRYFELGRGRMWLALQQKGLDCRDPSEIDDAFMCQKRIGFYLPRRCQHGE